MVDNKLMLTLAFAATSIVFCPTLPARSEAVTSCGRQLEALGEWEAQSPEQAGLDPAVLCELDAKLDRSSHMNVHGVVVVRGGKLVFETYRAGDDMMLSTPLGVVAHDAGTPHDVRSVSKSVVSLLFGMALDRGLIRSLDEPIFALLPEYVDLRTPGKDGIRLRHLLTMTSGLRWDEDMRYEDPRNSIRLMNESDDPYRYVLERELVHEPGTWWNYNSGNTMILAAVLHKVTGKEVSDLARDELFQPLGIDNAEWTRKRWYAGLRLCPRDLAKVGQLVLNDGTWSGHQIVSPAWIRESTEARFNGWPGIRYGYQWVLGASTVNGGDVPWIAGWGYGGQRLFIVPSRDLVVAITAGLYDTAIEDAVVMGVFESNVLAAVRR
jgi:CubicO group peptidase (beta-lactamase class C family)